MIGAFIYMMVFNGIGLVALSNAPSDIQLLGGVTLVGLGLLPLTVGSVFRSVLKANIPKLSSPQPQTDPQPPPTNTE